MKLKIEDSRVRSIKYALSLPPYQALVHKIDFSLSLDNDHISYYDSTNGNLKYAKWNGKWFIEILDSKGNVGEYSSIAVDSSDNPHISYYDRGQNKLKYAEKK